MYNNFGSPQLPVRTVAPSASEEILTLDEVKAHCRISDGDQDDLLNGLIATAIAHFDGYGGILGRALVSQTWSWATHCFYDWRIRLPLGNLISVTSVKYYDVSNVLQTVSGSVYGFATDHIGPYLYLIENQTWPTSLRYRDDAVVITWVCGWADAASVPKPIKQAMLLMIGDLFENREAQVIGVEINRNRTIDALIAPFRKVPT